MNNVGDELSLTYHIYDDENFWNMDAPLYRKVRYYGKIVWIDPNNNDTFTVMCKDGNIRIVKNGVAT